MPGLPRGLDLGQRMGVDPPEGLSLRRNGGGDAVAQAPLAVPHAGLSTQTFTEAVGQVPAGMRTTTRLREGLARARWLPEGSGAQGPIRWWRTDPWETGLVDLVGDQALLGQVDGRTSAAVRTWLNDR